MAEKWRNSPPIRQVGSGHWWLVAVARKWTASTDRFVREANDAVGSKLLVGFRLAKIIQRLSAPQ
jgi:hypothetical protein